jgi:hypothetical protein
VLLQGVQLLRLLTELVAEVQSVEAPVVDAKPGMGGEKLVQYGSGTGGTSGVKAVAASYWPLGRQSVGEKAAVPPVNERKFPADPAGGYASGPDTSHWPLQATNACEPPVEIELLEPQSEMTGPTTTTGLLPLRVRPGQRVRSRMEMA